MQLLYFMIIPLRSRIDSLSIYRSCKYDWRKRKRRPTTAIRMLFPLFYSFGLPAPNFTIDRSFTLQFHQKLRVGYTQQIISTSSSGQNRERQTFVSQFIYFNMKEIPHSERREGCVRLLWECFLRTFNITSVCRSVGYCG